MVARSAPLTPLCQAANALDLSLQFGDFAQLAAHRAALPRAAVQRWITRALLRDAELTVRVVGESEARTLNRDYRGKDYATNVLTFEYGLAPDGSASADIVLCLPIIKQEARAQRKDFLYHAAHLTVHGTLHALGYDHLRVRDAKKMEALEIEILAEMGISDPYYLA